MHNAPCRVDIAHKVSLFGGEVCIYCAGSCLVVPQLEIYGQVPQCMHPPKKEHNQFEFGLYSKLRNEGVRIGAMLQIRQSKWFSSLITTDPLMKIKRRTGLNQIKL